MGIDGIPYISFVFSVVWVYVTRLI